MKKILKKFKAILTTFLCFFLFPFVLFLAINFLFLKPTNLSENLCLFGVNISGLTQEEAKEKIECSLMLDKDDINMQLVYKDKNWNFDNGDFEIKTNIHTILDEVYKSSRHGGYINKKRLLNKIKKMGFDDKVAINYVFVNMDEKLDKIIKEIEKDAVDSTVSFNKTTNSFVITHSKNGTKVKRQKLYEDILSKLQSNNNIKIEIETESVLPNLTENDLTKSTKKQSTFSTNYAKSNANRKNNIKLATKTLNGVMIAPNEEFSFNKTIGIRSAENGYKQANIIQNGTFVKGFGGGVCQVSTTLYNALLLANIDVIEVHKHSLPVSYVSPGLDAMVSWNSADLKFKNTTNYPIFITSSCDGENIVFNVFGDTKKDNEEVKLKSEIIRQIPHGKDKIIPDKEGKYADKIMFKGEFLRVKSPKDGYEAKVYKEHFTNGILDKKEQIRHSTYDAQQGIVFEGVESLPKGMTLPEDSSTTKFKFSE